MNAVTLPAGTVYIKYSVAAHLLANALCPSSGAGDHRHSYDDARRRVDQQLTRAVELGDLPVYDPLTHTKHHYPIGCALREADIPVSSLRHFATLNGLPVIEIGVS